MTKRDLVAAVARMTHQQKNHTTEIAEALFAIIAEAVLREGRFSWPGFGTFYLRRTKARRVRHPLNPYNREAYATVPARMVLAFRASKNHKRVEAMR